MCVSPSGEEMCEGNRVRESVWSMMVLFGGDRKTSLSCRGQSRGFLPFLTNKNGLQR